MAFDQAMILAVWAKGRIAGRNQAKTWRKDACGAWMKFHLYGDRSSQYGWEIDHINAAGEDEDDDDSLLNLQPLQWQNNAAKGDGPLVCAVTADGKNNVVVGI